MLQVGGLRGDNYICCKTLLNKMAVSYSFHGQVVLVTGASSGIGAETAVHFAEAGCDGLAMVGRDQGRLEEVRDRCTTKGIDKSKILLIQEEMTKDGGPQRIMKAVEEKFGKLHILVNNAGIGGFSSLSDPELMEKYDKIYALNVRSTALLTQLAVPHLIETKGNIVNVSSVCAKAAVPNMLAYNISKAALDYFTESTARYLASKQVRVNSVK
ncbi:Dehydrogenase/reductase SDR family member 7 [Holothuria leucospilota]|uniref:Dehydrogenase/reductase SDR family member 7 n=1 Tax=Holothuria leucospilota TaxID=206669 RepID=A0A9Q1BGV6_HOLLE|nr:Dehydrogenase/reductase SDR family member 7 [Holothuria leucospilota]